MIDKSQRHYDNTITVRLENDVKERLLKSAETQNTTLSRIIRDTLTSNLLPQDLLASLPEHYQYRINQYIKKSEKNEAEVVRWLFSSSVLYYMNKGNVGF